MIYKIARAVGLNSDQRASLVSSVPKDSENLLLGVLQLTSDDAFTRGRQLLSELSDNFFEEEGSTPEKLTALLQKAKQALSDISEYSLLLASVSGRVLYLIGQGQVKIYLKRLDQLSPLMEEGNGQILSGFLERNDRIFLSSANLTDFLRDDLKNLMNLPLAQWEEEVQVRVGERTDDLAGLILDIEEEEKKEEAVKISYSTAPTIDILEKFRGFFPGSDRGRLVIGIVLILVIISGLILRFKNTREQEKQIIQEQSKQVEQTKPAVSFQEYLSLDLIKQGFSSKYLSLSDNKILMLDENNKTLVLLNLDKKSNQIIAGKDNLGDAVFASLNGNLAFVFSKDKGVLRVDTTNQKVVVVAKSDKEWGEIAGIYGFAGNVYLLDKGNPERVEGQVWKYLPVAEGYSDKRKYLNEGVKADFSSAKTIQIESSVYILKQGGEINRFTKGTADFFSLGGLDKPLKEAKTIFTSSEVDDLYILDADNARLLVTSKVGAFKQKYEGDKFAIALDLVVDEKNKKVYLLEGNKIYTMELQ